MKQIITISHSKNQPNANYYLGKDLLCSDHLTTLLHSKKSRCVIITDSNVEKLYGQKLKEYLNSCALEVSLLSFPAGEQHKTRETKLMLEDQLLAQRFSRDSQIIALGGGVVCDLAGYVASTFCRGIPYVLIPSTLLAMVDASVGGKTGVNTPDGKNLIGSFYPPEAIFADLDLLETLPEKERVTGCAEIIKNGLVGDKELFYLMLEDHAAFQAHDPHFFMQCIGRSVVFKKEIVEQDFFEEGKRSILNFGHTIGHALELLEGYQITHGEAIAIGMIVESFLSVKMGYLTFEQWEQIVECLKKYQFPFVLSHALSFQSLCEVMTMDKKSHFSRPRFVILSSIGSVAPFDGDYCSEVKEEDLKEAIAVLNELCVTS